MEKQSQGRSSGIYCSRHLSWPSPWSVSTACLPLASLLRCMLTAAGSMQSFGVWQARYGHDETVRDGIIRLDEKTQRSLISAVGSLGNGGLVAVFGIFYYPYLPRVGKWIQLLCFARTTLIAIGLAMASISHSVREALLLAPTHVNLSVALDVVCVSRNARGPWVWVVALHPFAYPSRILPHEKWARTRHHVCRSVSHLIQLTVVNRNSCCPWRYYLFVNIDEPSRKSWHAYNARYHCGIRLPCPVSCQCACSST